MICWKEIREKEGLGVQPSKFLKEDPEVAIAGSVVKICSRAVSVGEEGGEEQW
jgi:hypothetical protein